MRPQILALPVCFLLLTQLGACASSDDGPGSSSGGRAGSKSQSQKGGGGSGGGSKGKGGGGGTTDPGAAGAGGDDTSSSGGGGDDTSSNGGGGGDTSSDPDASKDEDSGDESTATNDAGDEAAEDAPATPTEAGCGVIGPNDACSKCIASSCCTEYGACLADAMCKTGAEAFGDCRQKATAGNANCVNPLWSSTVKPQQDLQICVNQKCGNSGCR